MATMVVTDGEEINKKTRTDRLSSGRQRWRNKTRQYGREREHCVIQIDSEVNNRPGQRCEHMG